MSEQLSNAQPIRLLKNGDLILIDKDADTKTVIAHFDRKTGDLEYQSKAISKMHARGIAFAIGTINAGKAVSGPVLAVGHLALGRVILRRYLDLPQETALMIGHPQDAVYVLEDGKVRWLTAEGREGEGLLPYERE